MDLPEERAERLRTESKKTVEDLIVFLPKCRLAIEQQWQDGTARAQLTHNPFTDYFPGGFEQVKRELVSWMKEIYGEDSLRVSYGTDNRTPQDILYIEKL